MAVRVILLSAVATLCVARRALTTTRATALPYVKVTQMRGLPRETVPSAPVAGLNKFSTQPPRVPQSQSKASLRRPKLTSPRALDPGTLVFAGGLITLLLEHCAGTSVINPVVSKPVQAAAAGTILDPNTAFIASNLLVIPFYALLLFRPGWNWTYRIMRNNWFLLPFSFVYGILLKQAWRPDFFDLLLPGSLDKWREGVQFLPSLEGVKELFGGLMSTSSVWVHLLLVDLFFARAMYLESRKSSEAVPVAHSIVLTWMFGPIGILSHEMTKIIYARKKGGAMHES